MASLLNLPGEILERIIFFLHGEHQQSSHLKDFSLSCKALFDLSEPYIYRVLRLDFSGQRGKSRALSLFTAFTNHPRRATYVRLLEARNWHKKKLTMKIEQKVFQSILTYLRRIITVSKLQPQDSWAYAVKHRVLDTWIALLVSQFHNLEILDLTFYPAHGSDFISRMLAQSVTMRGSKPTISTFDCLRTVLFRPDDKDDVKKISKLPPHIDTFQNYEITPEHIPALLNLPSLEMLQMSHLGSPGRNAPIYSTTNTLSPIKYLYIRSSRITETTLASLLHQTPSLQTLHYGAAIETESRHYISGSALLQSLQHIAPTLRTLQISLTFWSRYSFNEEAGTDWGLGCALDGPSFRAGFPQLVNLEIPVALLLGWEVQGSLEIADVVPPSVRTLMVSDDLAWFEEYEWRIEPFSAKMENLIDAVTHASYDTKFASDDGSEVRSPIQLRRFIAKVANFYVYGQSYRTSWTPVIAALQDRGRGEGTDVSVEVGVAWDEDAPPDSVDLDQKELRGVTWDLPRPKPEKILPAGSGSRMTISITRWN